MSVAEMSIVIWYQNVLFLAKKNICLHSMVRVQRDMRYTSFW